MAKRHHAWGALAAVLLVAACGTAEDRPSTGGATERTVNRPPDPVDMEVERRRQLYAQIFDQVEPCILEEFAQVSDRAAAGPVFVQFGFNIVGEAETAVLPEGGPERYDADADYREVVNAIILGVQRCAPLQDMPQAEHDIWGDFPLIFRPLEEDA